jgi:hypothetical protein
MEIVCGSERFTAVSTLFPTELDTLWGHEGHKRKINQAIALAMGRKCR